MEEEGEVEMIGRKKGRGHHSVVYEGTDRVSEAREKVIALTRWAAKQSFQRFQ